MVSEITVSPGGAAGAGAASFSVPFTSDTVQTPGAGGGSPPSALKGGYCVWGFDVTSPNTHRFMLPINATRLILSAAWRQNTLDTSSGRLQVFRTVGPADMVTTGVLIPGADLTWGPGDTTEKRLDLTGLDLQRGDTVAIFAGVTNDGGAGQVDDIVGGLILLA